MPCRRWIGGIALTLMAPFTWAALGSNESSVAQDGQPLGVRVTGHVARATPSNIHQQTIVDGNGVTITEYASQGVVFALRWSGPTLPNYSVLLASYFPQYQQYWRNQPMRSGQYRQPVILRQPRLVVHATGHMGSYQGSFYDPILAPLGLSLSALEIEP